MKNQFEIITIQKNIYLVREPYFYEHANMYVIKGSAFDLLIDCGVGLFNVRKFLEKRGFNIRVMLTHCHFDHAGGLAYFSPEQILVTKRVLGNLKQRKLLGLDFLKAGDFAKKQGLSVEKFCSHFKISVDKKIHPFMENNISVGDFNFDLLSCPGHTDDSIILFDKEKKILITGDTLYNGEMYADFVNSDRRQFKQSLQYLAKLPADIVLPGHNAVMGGKRAQKVIQRWLKLLNAHGDEVKIST